MSAVSKSNKYETCQPKKKIIYEIKNTKKKKKIYIYIYIKKRKKNISINININIVGKIRARLIELTSFKSKLLIRFIMNKSC